MIPPWYLSMPSHPGPVIEDVCERILHRLRVEGVRIAVKRFAHTIHSKNLKGEPFQVQVEGEMLITCGKNRIGFLLTVPSLCDYARAFAQ